MIIRNQKTNPNKLKLDSLNYSRDEKGYEDEEEAYFPLEESTPPHY